MQLDRARWRLFLDRYVHDRVVRARGNGSKRPRTELQSRSMTKECQCCTPQFKPSMHDTVCGAHASTTLAGISFLVLRSVMCMTLFLASESET